MNKLLIIPLFVTAGILTSGFPLCLSGACAGRPHRWRAQGHCKITLTSPQVSQVFYNPFHYEGFLMLINFFRRNSNGYMSFRDASCMIKHLSCF